MNGFSMLSIFTPPPTTPTSAAAPLKSKFLSTTKNVAATETAKTSELRRELESWRVAVGAERMLPNPDYDPSVQPSKKKNKKEVE
jgi:hypothetical protein